MENNGVGSKIKVLAIEKIVLKRYLAALGMILLMVGTAELLEEKEVIFPEMAALTIGMWIVDKRVWFIRSDQLIALMTVGAVAGVCLVRYSPLPLVPNLCLAFSFAAIALLVTGTTLVPLISACMLPVMLGTESWVYPIAVFCMSVLIVAGQWLLEKCRLRQKIVLVPRERNWLNDLRRWGGLLFSILLISSLAVYTANMYFIIPPLIVSYVEFVNSKAGFRNRPIQTFFLLVTASVIGVTFQYIGYYYLELPESIVALCIFACLFILFEWVGKYFAPLGALALIPMLLPRESLVWLPLQVAVGAAIFLSTAMIFFQKCYQWRKAQLFFCLTSAYVRRFVGHKKER